MKIVEKIEKYLNENNYGYLEIDSDQDFKIYLGSTAYSDLNVKFVGSTIEEIITKMKKFISNMKIDNKEMNNIIVNSIKALDKKKKGFYEGGNFYLTYSIEKLNKKDIYYFIIYDNL